MEVARLEVVVSCNKEARRKGGRRRERGRRNGEGKEDQKVLLATPSHAWFVVTSMHTPVCVCVCVCVRERDRERKRQPGLT